ncbi:hypothetical protein COCON_G00013860 [Conger conger]|uniref:(S)-2-hydroxy-acid oxidase n=1 Tax=Conger conger TaxID=82655 RepID=A0A9Q1E2Z6_CONCO|nr:hypothetical protein COCON_G00013860 [Conger conger]
MGSGNASRSDGMVKGVDEETEGFRLNEGADEQETLADNVAAFSRWRLYPRVLRDVSQVDMSISVLGQQLSMPVCVAATGMQKMAHPDGEIATMRACSSAGTGMMLSSFSTSSIEEVAEAGPSGVRWMQLYICKDRNLTLSLVRRAERAGYTGIFVTVDTPYLGRRRNDMRNQFRLPSHVRLPNLHSPDLVFSGKEGFSEDNSLAEYVDQTIDPSLQSEDIVWLKKMTSLPVVLKGVLTAEDAKLALQCGVDGILVSNHGGRQLDSVPATIDALPEIVEAVEGRVEVFLDGGVRRGTDVLKALALGARAVFVGRPILWGLACGGDTGVSKILQMLREELRLALALAGKTETMAYHMKG